MRKRITVYIDHLDDDTDFRSMKAWIKKWRNSIHIQDYSSGGAEHIWDFDGPIEAIGEIPEDWLCSSDWAGFDY